MKDFNESQKYPSMSQLSGFANLLNEKCRCQPVRFAPKQKGRLFLIQTVELAEGGLNLMLEERDIHFIAMEDIGRNTFYCKHHDPL